MRSFTPILMALLGLLSHPAHAEPFAISSSGWRLQSTGREREPLYSEFKYFIFEDRAHGVSGNITFYSRQAPGLTRNFSATIHVFEKGRVLSYQVGYRQDCVRASAEDPGLELCGRGGIRVLGARSLGITLNEAKAKLDLVIAGPADVEDLPLQTMDLSSKNLKPAILALARRFDMSWKPIFPYAKMSGTISLGNANYVLREVNAYSDENFGSWVPGDQPYRWYRFHGESASGKVTALWLDFPRQSTGWTPLFVLSQGQREGVLRTPHRWKTYSRDEASYTVTESRPASSLRYRLTSRELLKTLPAWPALNAGPSHQAPSLFTIATRDGAFRVENRMTANDATGLELTRHVPFALRDFVINDQLADGTLSWINPLGAREEIHGETEAQWILPLD